MPKTQYFQKALIAFVCLNLVTAAFADNTSPAAPVTDPEYLKAQDVFHHYMDEEPLRHIYRKAQWELLNTSEDTAFTHFFYNANEHFGHLFDQLKVEHKNELEEFSRYAQTNMMRIRPGYIKKFDRIDAIVSEVAKSIGFSSESIKNREIYIQGGEMNAFTVSGDNNRIIVVIHTDLIERLTNNELRAVLAHELGHIRSLHSVKHAMHELFLRFIIMSYSSSDVAQQLAPEMLNMQAWDLQAHDAAFEKIIMSHGRRSNRRTNNNQATALVGDPSPIGMALVRLMNLQPPQRNYLVKGYLSILVQTLIAENGSPATIQYFQELLNNGLGSQALTIDVGAFSEHAKHAFMAISRAQEKSCDRYATSMVPNDYVASTMAKLGGQPLQPIASLAVDERAKIIEMIKRQVKEFHDKYSSEDISSYVGSTHPAISLRLVNILDIPSYPEILFANPFLRLLLLEDLLASPMYNKPELKKFRDALPEDIVTLVEDFGLSSKTNARFNKLVQYYALNKRLKIEANQALSVRTIPEQVADKDKVEINKILVALDKDSKAPVTVLTALEKRLKDELRNSSLSEEQKGRVKKRLETIQNLQQTQDLNALRAIHAGTLPAVQTNKGVMSKSIPVDAKSISNPYKEMTCRQLLTYMKEPAAAVTATGTTSSP